MDQPGNRPFPDQGDATAEPSSDRSTATGRWSRLLRVALALTGLLLVGGLVEALTDSSRTALAVAGAVAGLTVGTLGVRQMPPTDEIGGWLAFSVPKGEQRPDRTWSLIVRGLLSGAIVFAAMRFLLPPIEPFPTTFFSTVAAVVISAVLIRSRRPVRDTSPS